MLVMEHSSGIGFQQFNKKIREQWLAEFEASLSQLYEAGFVFRGWGEAYDSIRLTEQGLRLIEVGPSAIRLNVGDVIFEKYVKMKRRK